MSNSFILHQSRDLDFYRTIGQGFRGSLEWGYDQGLSPYITTVGIKVSLSQGHLQKFPLASKGQQQRVQERAALLPLQKLGGGWG